MKNCENIILAFVCFIAVFVFSFPVTSYDDDDDQKEENPKIIKAIKISSEEAPDIDGKLDDEAWKKAQPVSDFLQYEPVKGGKPGDPTMVYVLFDTEKIYIGFECHKKNPDKVIGMEMKRDGRFFQDDFVEVFLDTYHDRRNCYAFSVNCLGTQADRRIANEGSMRSGGPFGDRSRAWDCAWDAGASRDDKGWTAELAIPFSELRFDKKGDGTWGINFWRGNEELEEEDTWADVGEEELAVSKFGVIVGLTPEEFSTRRALEFKPYGTIKPQLSPERDIEPDAGIDLRYPSTTITADFTFNPDFAQVEADPARINLDDVERRFPEKRPFFQEGMELFQSPIELFYTRRVGIKDLMYGAKAVGKLGSYNMALLGCKADDTVESDDEEEPEEETEDETDNKYLVFRGQRDVGRNSSIGILGVNKQKANDYNRIGSVDFNLSLPKDTRLMGQYANSWSHDLDDNAFILELKGSVPSGHYDLSYVDVGPDFEAETGFVPRIDRRGFRGGMGYEYDRNSDVLKSIRTWFGGEKLENHKSVTTNERAVLELGARFLDFYASVEPQWYYHVDPDNEDKFYTDKTVFFFTGWFPPKWATIMNRVSFGKQDDRDMFFIAPEIRIIPTQKLRIEFDLERLDKEGEPLMLNRRLTTSYQFSHKMFVRTTFEMSRDAGRYIFGLFGWEFRPESNLYFVYTDEKEKDVKESERIIFIKLSYLLKWKPF
ncbi:hypothetical protein GF312_21470 [Candidatus Poribacteria bacterium]|nr:hypothetical protein [Candidatus Poribacteria bacterium]